MNRKTSKLTRLICLSVVAILAALALSGCASPTTAGQTLPPPTRATTAAPRDLTDDLLKNARYTLPSLGTVDLFNGSYENKYGEGATQVNRAGFHRAAFGDLNGDGVEDAAVIVWWSGGGSGTFYNLAAMVNVDGQPRQAGVQFLGDRTQIQSLVIKDGQIMLDMTSAGPKDPMSSPTRQSAQVYKLELGPSGSLEGATLKKAGETVTIPTGQNQTLDKVKYNPETHQCANEPRRILTDHTWQAYAAPTGGKGGDAIKAGQEVMITIRNKLGDSKEQYDFTVAVIAPDGSSTTARVHMNGNEWTQVFYAKDFANAKAVASGIYTVIWQTADGVVLCTGFVVDPA